MIFIGYLIISDLGLYFSKILVAYISRRSFRNV